MIREIKIHVYPKRQTWIFTTWPSFPLIAVYCLLLLHKNKKFHTSFIHKNCFGQFSSAHFLFWEILNLNLKFAVNVNLNLTIVIYRYCDLILEVRVNVSQNSVLIAPFRLSLPCREGLRTEWVTRHINQMWPAANILLLRESSKGGGGGMGWGRESRFNFMYKFW